MASVRDKLLRDFGVDLDEESPIKKKITKESLRQIYVDIGRHCAIWTPKVRWGANLALMAVLERFGELEDLRTCEDCEQEYEHVCNAPPHCTIHECECANSVYCPDCA